MNSYQNYEYEEEIDLIKLILFVLSKWKSIVACVVAGAILGGALALLMPNIPFGSKDEDEPKYTADAIEEKVFELQEGNAEIASQAVVYAMDLIEESKLMNVDPYNMYVGSISMVSFAPLEDLIVMESALNSFNQNRVLYNELSENEDFYSKKDLNKLISLSVSTQTEEDRKNNIATITAYGTTEEEVDFMLTEAESILKNYLKDFSAYSQIPAYYGIKSDITLTENRSIADYQKEVYNNLITAIENEKTAASGIEYEDSVFKTLVIYVFVGAFLMGVASAGVWFVVFFASGKLYAVSDIERKFGVKLLGSVAVCDKKNPIDKWIFHKMNGLYSEFSEDEQKKIVLLNILNELKKNESIKKVMLVSSLGDKIKDSAAFVKSGLEKAGYTVSDCVNVVGRSDVLSEANKYDVALVLENNDISKNNLVKAECSTLKEYFNDYSMVISI